MTSLRELFGLLEPASQPGQFSAVTIPDYEDHRIARDASGAPFVLVYTDNNESGVLPPPTVELENLQVRYDVRCQVTGLDDNQEEGRFSVIGCVNSDPALQEHFLRVMEGLLPAIGPKPTQNDLAQVLDRAVQLFRMMGRPARTSIRGLWGELFIIAHSDDPATLVSSWHQDPSDVYDFNRGGQRVEVKTASGDPRRHHFSQEQLHEPEGTEVVVVSLLVQRAGAGASVFDLVDDIRDGLGSQHELVTRLDDLVAESLGRDWRRATDDRFDPERAAESIEFYRAGDVPHIEEPLPDGVSSVQFIADLSSVEPIISDHFEGTTSLFGSL